MFPYKQSEIGGAAGRAVAKSVQRFSSYETTQHKNLVYLTFSRIVKTY
jgi:hypothetical protein